MKRSFNIMSFIQILTFVLAWGWSMAVPPLVTAVESGSPGTRQWTVVIDPGHGGHDTGVKGPGGTLEKDVTLRLARLLQNRLKDRYQVVLTRSDDYTMERQDRTGQANHTRADLLVSLHAAGSYSHATRGLPIYYYTGPAIKTQERSPDEATAATAWHEIQQPHILASSILAQRVADKTKPLAAPRPTKVQSAPLAVLAGADMPAILIETGYLTNPKQEKNLNDNKYLFNLAAAISQGIDDFFNKPDTIASSDLRE